MKFLANMFRKPLSEEETLKKELSAPGRFDCDFDGLKQLLSKERRYNAITPRRTQDTTQAIAWHYHNNLTFDQLKETLPLVKGSYEYQEDRDENDYTRASRKAELVEYFFEKTDTNLTVGQLTELFPLMPGHEVSATSAFLKKGAELSVSELKTIAERGGFEVRQVAGDHLYYESDVESKYTKLKEIINGDHLGSKYNYNSIVRVASDGGLPREKVPDLCRDLYPANERIQAELFNCFITATPFSNHTYLRLNAHDISNFVGSLQDDDIALDVLKTVTTPQKKSYLMATNDRPYLNGKSDILDIANIRVGRQYKSVAKQLENKTAADSLIETGLLIVRTEFGKDPREVPLSSLFAYYDIYGDPAALKSIIKPDVLNEIRAAFRPKANDAYISATEYPKLQTLMEIELPSVRDLSDYLRTKVPPVPLLDSEAIATYKINYSNASFIPQEQHVEIENNFKALLRDPSPSPENVALFFEQALALEDKINPNHKVKLSQAFEANKNELAYLLRQEQGLDTFRKCIASVSDGCVANIGTVVRIAVTQALIKDPSDQVLYSVFSQNIAMPIINSGGDLLGSDARGANILDIRKINNAAISSPGLVVKLQKEFYDDKQQVRDPWNLIGKEKGHVMRNILSEILMETPGNFNDHAAELASFIMLQKTLPQLLNSPYLTDFKARNAEILESAAAMVPQRIKEDIQDAHLNKRSRAIDALNLAEKKPRIAAWPEQGSWIHKIQSQNNATKNKEI